MAKNLPKLKALRPNNRGLEPEDYYLNEQGLMVFTSAYHLKRGYCCKSCCKHCPWNYKRV